MITQIADKAYLIKNSLGDDLVIGESGNKFLPVIKANRWQECSLGLLLPIANLSTATITSASIKYENTAYAVEYREAPPKLGFNEFGGLDQFITLKKRPPTNQIVYEYESSLISAYHQPAILTPDEIARNAYRPEHVQNSIVFYHATMSGNYVGGKEYRAGKIGSLYRMKAVDANGIWTWLDWSIVGSKIIGTVSQAFLDNAKYPVVIMPVGDTFGYTSIGGTYGYGATNLAYAQLGTPVSSGTVSKLTVYGSTDTGTATYVKAVIWLHSSLAIITNGVGGIVELLLNSPAWRDMPYSTQPSVTGSTAYIPGVVYDAQGGAARIYYDTAGSSEFHEHANNYSSPINMSSPTHYDIRGSIYGTYTVAGGGWAHKFNGVANASISKINGVAKASISKVNGVA